MPDKAIILVDDEAIILLAIKRELRNHFGDAFLYETALDAARAMEIIDELEAEGVRVVLVITDWLMPGIPGDEFLVRIRRRYPDIRSIMITGQAKEDAVRRAIEDGGAFVVLGKPWNSEELARAVERCFSAEDHASPELGT